MSGNVTGIRVVMYEKAGVRVSELPDLIASYDGSLKLVSAGEPFFILKPRGSALFGQEEMLLAVKKLLIEIKRLLD